MSQEESISTGYNVYDAPDQTEAWLIYDEYGPIVGSPEPLPVEGLWEFRSFPSEEAARTFGTETFGESFWEGHKIQRLDLGGDRPSLEENLGFSD